ncbi:hypothetical protein CPC08DRAFT_264180 [Agrocybe pediades]|nr:hypothetical protein CPC08DRAFT_264180 [Agrocybe pediades]
MDSTDINVVQDDVPGAHISSLCLRGEGGYSHACCEIANLEREADETSKKLADIFERLANAKSKANHIRSTMLAKLPNEILSLIFCAAWSAVDPSPRERDRFHYYEKQQEETRLSVALLVAGVCQKWRAIALSLPRIWADVRIFIHRQKGDRALSVLRDIMKRSKRAGLTIRLFSPPNGDMMQIDRTDDALAILQQEAQRWRSLEVCVPHMDVLHLFEPRMDLSGVHSLYVHSNHNGRSIFLGFPLWKDKNLRPQRVMFDKFIMSNVKISWDRVTHVVANQFTIDQAMTVIRSAPLLTSLELMEPDEIREARTLYSPNFVHENLQRVTYLATGRCANGAKSIFSFNVFPALKVVDYHTRLSSEEDSFLDHLIRNKPPIQELKLHGSPYRSYYVVAALEAISSTLVKLDFGPCEDDFEDSEYDDLFDVLAAFNSFPPPSNDDREMFLPHLESLRFSSVWPFGWDRVPRFFGLPTDPHRRPLKEFIFDDYYGNETIIPMKYLFALVGCRESGFVVRSWKCNDLIQESLNYHISARTTSS